ADDGPAGARALAGAVRDALPPDRPGVVAIGTESGGSAVVVTATNRAARTAGHDAAALVRRLLNGKGGGSPELAQGGGLPAGELARTLKSVKSVVAEHR
ncbi:DHHA1 domain-containing protein, partial [Streptomyces bauhiniae]